MLIKRNQSQGVTYYMVPFIWYSLKGKIIGTQPLSSCQGLWIEGVYECKELAKENLKGCRNFSISC